MIIIRLILNISGLLLSFTLVLLASIALIDILRDTKIVEKILQKFKIDIDKK